MSSEAAQADTATAMEKAANSFLDVLLEEELLEVDCVPAMQQINSLLSLQAISPNSKQVLYHLRHPEGNKSQWIVICAAKGSFFTYCWNTCMRFDDEYLVLIFDEEEAARSCTEAINTNDQLPDNTVLHMKGFDAVNKRLLNGFVDWRHIRDLKSHLNIRQIGPIAFAKILHRMLFLLPLYVKHNQYLIPMPIALMFNCLIMVETSPLILNISQPKFNPIQAMAKKLVDSHGKALWIESFFPFWNRQGEKYLCTLLNVEPGSFPIGSTDIFHESGVRLVEIAEQQLGRDGYIAVIEFVHKKRWMQNVRFVVLDLPGLLQSVGLLSETGKSLIPVRIYDELEYGKLFPSNRYEAASNSKLEIDFRNSCHWGKLEKDLIYK